MATVSESLSEFDYIQTADGVVWVVHGANEEGIVCHPKYIPNSALGDVFIGRHRHVRLGSPIFAEDDSGDFGCLSRYRRYVMEPDLFKRLYLISDREIASVYRTRAERSWGRSRVAQVHREFTDEIVKRTRINDDCIGVTGSVLLAAEKDGYSDLDIVIYGSRAYEAFCAAVSDRGCADLRRRSRQEWCDFYDQYAVRSRLSRSSFVDRMEGRFDRGLFRGIAYTIFVGCESLRYYRKRTGVFVNKRVHGVVVNVDGRYCYPSKLIIDSPEKRYEVESWDRADAGTMAIGDDVTICGYVGDDEVIVVPWKGWIARTFESVIGA